MKRRYDPKVPHGGHVRTPDRRSVEEIAGYRKGYEDGSHDPIEPSTCYAAEWRSAEFKRGYQSGWLAAYHGRPSSVDAA
jgi:hypothetical protein